MKKALHKDFWMEIRKSKARFISIFCIVALGVAFFSGIQAASPDMRFSGDAYYDASRLMDIKVVGTMGLTDEDVQALEEIRGVQEAEGAYSTDVICEDEDVQNVLHIESVNETVNQLTADEGRVPENSGECFVDNAFANEMGLKVGDKLSVIQDGDSELLLREEFDIVGIGSCPLYISFNRGNTTLGSGEVSGFAYVLPEDFNQEVYTQIYLRVHGAEELVSYSDEYDNLIEKIQAKVEGIEEERCRFRYETVVADAEEELDDARRELEDGRREAEEELADAEKELKDGEKELADGRKEYEDGKKELADAKEELKDGKKQIEDAKKELEDGRSQLADAKKELADGKAQLADARAQTADGWRQIASAKQQTANGWAELQPARDKVSAGWTQLKKAQAELDKGKSQLSAAKKELAAGKQKIKEGKATLEAKQAELDAAREQVTSGKAELETSAAQLAQQKQQCEEGLASVEAAEAQLSEQQAALEGAQAQLAGKQAEYDSAVAEGVLSEEELSVMAAELEAIRGQVESQAAELEGYRQQLAAQRSELENGLAAVEGGLAQIETKRAELAAAEAQLEPGQQAIDEGWAELKAQEAKIPESEQLIKDNEKKLNDGQAELEASRKELVSGQAQVDAGIARLNSAEAEIAANEEKLRSAEAEIAANEQKLADGEQEIADSEKKIADGEQEIADNEKKITDGEKEIKENEEKLKDAEKDLKDAEKKLEDGWKEYEDGKKEAEEEIADGEREIEDAQKEIDDLKVPEWIVTDRNGLPEYSDYGDNADRIRNIGQVFPVIFFLVAALISLTTMTRMVEEQRTQIGTLKALGYGKFAIASKYLGYAFLATVGGSIVGILIGEKILPYIIITAYGIMYHNMATALRIPYELKYALIASCASVVCTLGATVFSCYKELADTPAALMRPPAPKEGKRVLIERMTFLWKRLNFTWKSTLRNLFRYKKRLFMTIFGIAGSMALMLVGYGIKDSVSDIAVRQYTVLQHYDGTIINDEDATEKEYQELVEYLDSNGKISHYTPIQLSNMTIPNGKSNLNAYVYVPENLENFHKDVTLQDRVSGEAYELTDEGAVICEKTATLLGLKVGDEIVLEKDHKKYSAPIAAVTENYMGHYVYMTPKVYEEAFGEVPDYADIAFTVKEEYKEETEAVGLEILEYPAALSISYTSSIAGQIDRMLSTLGMVIVVLIISAGMLAFVVLYNLNNINITERQRELATLKVLGFFDKEVSQYVLRENILLTVIGMIAGSVFGVLLHRFVIVTVEVDAVMFGREIRPISFLYCALFTIIFSVVVNAAMHFKLKKIDMVESLKSVE